MGGSEGRGCYSLPFGKPFFAFSRFGVCHFFVCFAFVCLNIFWEWFLFFCFFVFVCLSVCLGFFAGKV